MLKEADQKNNQITLRNGVILPVKRVRMKRTADGRFVTVSRDEDARDEAAIASKAPENILDIGAVQPDGTVYLGQYQPKDRDGKSLSKTFNVFAAPEDLPDTMKYVDAVKHVSNLKGWNGYDGTNYETDKEIYKALEDGSYNGGWIIPTRDILHGNDVAGNEMTPDNLFKHKNTGAFKGTFKTAARASGSDYPDWYWSSSQDPDDSSLVYDVRFSDGYQNWDRKDGYRLSCRPVRLVAPASSRVGEAFAPKVR